MTIDRGKGNRSNVTIDRGIKDKGPKEETRMSKHNYTQYSNKKQNNENNKPLVPADLVVEEPDVVIEQPVVEPVVETVDTVVLPSVVNGVVIDCAKLNVREEPSLDANVVCVLDAKSEVRVDTTDTDGDWFYIYTATGVEGYCMKKYIKAHM